MEIEPTDENHADDDHEKNESIGTLEDSQKTSRKGNSPGSDKVGNVSINISAKRCQN